VPRSRLLFLYSPLSAIIGARLSMNNTNIKNKAVKMAVSTIGLLVGTASMIHGIFEVLQGNIMPDSLVTNAIGQHQKIWEYAALHIFTIIPNMLATGIMTIIIGLFFTLWAAIFITKKNGAWLMFILSILLFLVGGGSGPLFIGIIISIIATRIYKPLKLWQEKIPTPVTLFFSKMWPWIIYFYIFSYIFSVVFAITGIPFILILDLPTAYNVLLSMGYFLLFFMSLVIVSALSVDSKKIEA